MGTAAKKVFDKLKESPKGITHWDFPRGFALRSRISDLRSKGSEIRTMMEKNTNNTGNHARYVLVK